MLAEKELLGAVGHQAVLVSITWIGLFNPLSAAIAPVLLSFNGYFHTMYCHALPPHASTLLLFALLASNTLWAQLPAKSQNGYKLVWQDEFNHTGQPDTTKWRFENGFKRNQEAQWYQAENAHCAGGYLVITAKKEEKPNPNYKPDSKNWTTRDALITYTSASVVMHKAHAFKFGKLEVRAKLDAQTGLWPAIWTLGVDGEWPSNGEVDLMEYYNGGILANIAIADTGRHRAIWDGAFRHLDSLGGKAWADAFHIWTLEWDTDYMRIFVDGQLLNEIDLQHSINKTDGKNPFRQPHYVLLNLAMGGTKGGSLQNTSLPSQYLIDYVRIYQKKR